MRKYNRSLAKTIFNLNKQIQDDNKKLKVQQEVKLGTYIERFECPL